MHILIGRDETDPSAQEAETDDSLWARVIELWTRCVTQVLCRHTHALRKFEPHAVRLECQDCGYVSPGWTVGKS